MKIFAASLCPCIFGMHTNINTKIHARLAIHMHICSTYLISVCASALQKSLMDAYAYLFEESTIPTLWARVNPMVPVPQHTSKRRVLASSPAQSPAWLYNFSAADVLTYIEVLQIMRIREN